MSTELGAIVLEELGRSLMVLIPLLWCRLQNNKNVWGWVPQKPIFILQDHCRKKMRKLYLLCISRISTNLISLLIALELSYMLL